MSPTTPTSPNILPPRRPRLRSVLAAGLTAAAATALSSCTAELLTAGALVTTSAAGSEFLPVHDASNLPPEKEPVATAVRHIHEVTFDSGEPELTADQRRQLDGFVARRAPGYATRLYVEAGPAGDRVSRRRADLVAVHLGRHGLDATIVPGVVPVSTAGVNVVAASHVVTLPACPDWTSEPGNTWSNQPHSNWGCANASNLGMMVADPGHLNEGAPYQPLDGEYATLAIQRYQRGEIRELAPEDVGVTQAQQKVNNSGGGGDS